MTKAKAKPKAKKEKGFERIRNHLRSDGRLQTWYLNKEGGTVSYKEEYIAVDEVTKRKLLNSEKRRYDANVLLHRSAVANDRVRGLPPIPGDTV